MSSKGETPDDKKSKDKPGANRPGIDADAVRELAGLLKETGLTEIEIEHNGARIRVSRGAVAAASAPAPVAAPAATPQQTPAPAPSSGPPAGAVPSPMVGTVYVSPEPGRAPFISVGKPVKEGETLFIIEAMKTMNAITAPRSGTVKEINVTDGTPVEFGQTLCVIA